MKKKRDVRIEVWPGMFFVRIVNRCPRQRYCAAQFDKMKPDATPRTLADVEAWVKSQPHLNLIP